MNAVLKPKIKLSDFKSALAESIQSGEIPQVEPPVEHYHTPDLYGRRIFVPAGTGGLTKVHKSEHITIALKGTCTVVDERGVKTEVVAPAVFITKPGTWRAVYAHDDVEWVTVHACKETDIQKIEAQLVCDELEEADQEDYERVLIEYGIDEKFSRTISENTTDLIPMPKNETKVSIKPSSIEGNGVFAEEDMVAGCRIGSVRINLFRTPIGRYANHSVNPNCEFRVTESGNVDAYALRPIYKGQEVTVCYRLARKVSIAAAYLLEKQS